MTLKHTLATIAGATALLGGTALAEVIVLDFEGLDDQEAVGGFYNGGTSENGNSGTNYGIEFSDDTLSIIDRDAGGSGNFGNEPSPDTILFFLEGDRAVMNVAAGFENGFSFFYTSLTEDAFVNVYSGLDGTGDILATLMLGPTGSDCSGDPTGQFCNFEAIGASFVGVAFSVAFGGVANQVGFDDITFGSAVAGGDAVPLPGALILFGSAIAGGAAVRRKAKAQA